MEVQCPQCGNPNLDVDEQNSVVYCKNCGFAVRVDPQSGQVVPLSEGGPQQGGNFEPPAAYSPKQIFGTDPLTFLLGATGVLLVLTWINILTTGYFAIFEAAVFLLWWYGR